MDTSPFTGKSLISESSSPEVCKVARFRPDFLNAGASVLASALIGLEQSGRSEGTILDLLENRHSRDVRFSPETPEPQETHEDRHTNPNGNQG